MFAAIAFLIVGLVLLVYSADFLVKGAANIAAALGISPLVVGLTVVAFGTSAPELAVSVMSAFKGQADIAVGNVVGSNIFNVLFILGVSALIIPLVVHAQLVRFDVPVMIGVSVLLYVLSMDGLISRVDGIVLAALLLVYVIFLLRLSKKEKDAGVLSEYEQEYGKPAADPKWLKNILFVLGGVAGLVIGLTVVAFGTSAPEMAVSAGAVLGGQYDIAIGNVVGSTIFNVLFILGASALIVPLVVNRQIIRQEVPILIGATILLIVMLRDLSISMVEGGVLFSLLIVYTVFLVVQSRRANRAMSDVPEPLALDESPLAS